MKTVFLTGCTGDSGPHFLTALSDRYHVLALVRKKPPVALDNVEWVVGDLSHVPLFSSFLSETDFLVHLGAYTRNDNRALLQKINVEGTHELLSAAKENRVASAIVFSTAAVTHEWLTPYAKSKILMEKKIMGIDLPMVIMRPTIMYHQGGRMFDRFLSLVKNPFPVIPLPNNGNALINPVYTPDVARWVAERLRRPVHGKQVVDAGYRFPYSLQAFIRELLHLTRVKKNILDFPPSILLKSLQPSLDTWSVFPNFLYSLAAIESGYRIDSSSFYDACQFSITTPAEGIRKCLMG